MNASKLTVALAALALLGIGLNLAGIPLNVFTPLAFGMAVASLTLLAAVRDYAPKPQRYEPAHASTRRPALSRYPLAA